MTQISNRRGMIDLLKDLQRLLAIVWEGQSVVSVAAVAGITEAEVTFTQQ